MVTRIATTMAYGITRFDFSELEALKPPVDPEESTDQMVRCLLETRRARKAAVTPDKP